MNKPNLFPTVRFCSHKIKKYIHICITLQFRKFIMNFKLGHTNQNCSKNILLRLLLALLDWNRGTLV